MPRKYTDKTLKQLFAVSGNKCSYHGEKYPNGCQFYLVDENGVFIGDIAHIEALNKGGLRHNPNLEKPNESDNLMIMCPNHHRIIDNNDNEKKYPTSLLKQWKKRHESKYKDSLYETTEVFRESVSIRYEIDNSQNISGANVAYQVRDNKGIVNNTTNQYYGDRNIRESEKDDVIIKEIFEYIDENIMDTKDFDGNSDFTQLQKKVPLNFDSSYAERLDSMIFATSRRRLLVTKHLRDLSGKNDKALLLEEKIQSEFCRIKDSKTQNVRIADINVIEEMAKSIIPETKRNDSLYLGNAKAIILHFFEYCKIGKKTSEEEGKQIKLFDYDAYTE